MGKNYFMIRAMKSREEDFNVFFKSEVAAVGWSNFNFMDTEIEQLLSEIRKMYDENGTAARVVGKKLNEIRRFLSIKKGDMIIVPYYGSVCFAEAQGEFKYSVEDIKYDLANQIEVKYYKKDGNIITIPRTELPDKLQKRLRVRGSTVSNLNEFGNEIEQIVTTKNYKHYTMVSNRMDEQINEFKAQLLTNIRKGNTYLQSGGYGLEILVKELFECEGYTARICAKNEFPGFADADIEAVKEDKFSETKLLIQVKHHNGKSDDWGVKQLEELMRVKNNEEYLYVFITSAYIESQIRENAENKGIQVIDGDELSDWIYDNVNKLSSETLGRLGISSIPRLLW